MQLTNVTLFPSKFGDSMIKAYGRIELENAIVLDINVIDTGGANQPFMSFPNRRKISKAGEPDKYVAPVFLKNKEDQQRISSEVVAKYEREIKYSGATTGESTPEAQPQASEQTAFPF